MTKYDIKYIIKKILIYSGVAIILMFVKSCDIKALEVQSASFTFNRMYITNGGVQGAYNVQQVNYNGTYMQGYQGSQLQTVSKFAYELPVGFKTLMNDYEFVSFQLYTNGTSPVANIGINCDKTSSIVASSNFTDYSSGYVNYTCRINHTPQDYISFYTAGTSDTTRLSTILLSKEFYFFNTGEGETASAVNEVNNTINNDNVDNQQSSDFFNNFGSTTNQGLQDLIKKPIDIIDSFYNTCSPITFNIPYFDTTITLPCISSIQNDFTSVIFPIIRVIINGLLCYRILTKFIDEINRLKDPNNSDLEVVDL